MFYFLSMDIWQIIPHMQLWLKKLNLNAKSPTVNANINLTPFGFGIFSVVYTLDEKYAQDGEMGEKGALSKMTVPAVNGEIDCSQYSSCF